MVAVLMDAAHMQDPDAVPERHPSKLSQKYIDKVKIWSLKVVSSGSGSIQRGVGRLRPHLSLHISGNFSHLARLGYFAKYFGKSGPPPRHA
jgi:hypothetical protein